MESTIRNRLCDLVDRNESIVTTLEAEADNMVPKGILHKYYGVTEYGVKLLKTIGVYEQIGILYDVYEAADLRLPDGDDRLVTIGDIQDYSHYPESE